MKTIILATRNEKKKKELEKLLKGLRAKALSLNDLKAHMPIIVENGSTFRQNAVKKALIISRFTREIVLADDSGLEVDYLGGKPGVRSSRFAHAKANDGENNSKLLRLMKDAKTARRQAAFVCHVAVARNGALLGSVEGRCKGRLGFKPKGKNGFGYDPLFIPNGFIKTFAQINGSSKNRISHRARAVAKAKKIIKKYL